LVISRWGNLTQSDSGIQIWRKYFEGIFECGEDLDSSSRVTLKMMADSQRSPVLSDLRS